MKGALLFATLVASFTALLSEVEASEFRDARGRFVVAVPEGWTAETPTNTDTITVILGADKKGTEAGAACLAVYLDIPSTRSATQAELNSVVEGQLTKEFWISALQSSGENSLTITSTGHRDKDGRRIHSVVFAGKSTSDGKESNGSGKMEVHFVPGSMHSMMCVTDTSAFATHSPAFEQVFASYEPGRAAVIAGITGTQASALTLFARASYQGQAQVLSSDTPDLPAAGLVATAGSLLVDGSTSWQVCDGRNYSGTCRILGSGGSESGAVVLSARPIPSSFAPKAAAATALRQTNAGLSVLRR